MVICSEKLGPLAALCDVSYVLEAVCYSVKFLDYVCELIDFVTDAIVGVVKKSKFFNENQY